MSRPDRTRAQLLSALALAVLAGCVTDRPAPVVDRGISVAKREPQRPPDSYQVERGDTLYSIAFRYGLDVNKLARWNGIQPPYTIYPGQSLRFEPGAEAARGRTAPAQGPSSGVTTEPLAESAPDPEETRRKAPPENRPAEPVTAPREEPARPGREPAAEPESEPEKPELPAEPTSGPLEWQWPADGPTLSRFAAGDASRNGLDIGGESGTPVRAAAAGQVVYSGSGLIGYGELIIVKHANALLSAYGHNRKRLVQEGDRVRAGQQIAEMGQTGAPRPMLHFEIREDGTPVDPMKYLPGR